MSERTCLDCAADISGRHWRSRRCESCQRERDRAALAAKAPTLYDRTCGGCGKAFKARGKRVRACSVQCGGKMGHPGNVTKVCVVCDKTFTISRQYERETCSRACRSWHIENPDRKPSRQCRWCGDSLAHKGLRAEWCDDRCWHADHEGVSWEWVKTRRCVVCNEPIPRSVNYQRVVCSAVCRTRNRSVETLFRQAHARRQNMDAAKVYRVPKAYIRKLRTMPCYWCGGIGGTADHVVPISRGGKHSEGNLVPACRSCNSSKRDLLLVEWKRRREMMGTWSQDVKPPRRMRQAQNA
jgi:HNH endonuclease